MNPIRLIGMALACLALCLLAGCVPATTPAATPTTIAAPLPTATPTPPPTALPSPTPIPQRLVACSVEPSTLSPFDPSLAGREIAALFYDDPVERVAYGWEPRLLERVPTFDNDGALTRTVTLMAGRRYVDATNAVRLNTGDILELSQLVVTFTLRNDVLWSDGAPLTTEDVLFAYRLVQAAEARGEWRDLAERTERLEALDERRVRWTGLPGYLDADFPGLLFPPQPAHRYQGQSLTQVLEDRAPLGTGPFRIVKWEAGQGIRLEPNPYYLGAPPKLEEITVRFTPYTLEQWPQLIASGECDVILPDPAMKISWLDWMTLVAEGQGIVWADAGASPVFLRLDFNTRPADGRKTPLADPQVRQALAHCIDRGRLAEAMPGQALVVAESFVPAKHPAFAGNALQRTPHDLAQAQALLDAAGWQDANGDGLREAHNVAGFSNGAPLSLTLYLVPQYTVAAANIAADLETCGVGVAPRPTDLRLFYAADAVSPLFGRQFDLALFGWMGTTPQICGAWRSERIPGAENAWIGENFSGYSSAAYDAACDRALTTADAGAQYAALQEAAALLSRDLPTLFLVWRPYWFVARPQVWGIQPDASNAASLWNIERIRIGE